MKIFTVTYRFKICSEGEVVVPTSGTKIVRARNQACAMAAVMYSHVAVGARHLDIIAEEYKPILPKVDIDLTCSNRKDIWGS